MEAAKAKIEQQTNDSPVSGKQQRLGQYLLAVLAGETVPEGLVDKINLPEKTLAKATAYVVNKAQEVAKEHKDNSCAMVESDVVFGWFLEYFLDYTDPPEKVYVPRTLPVIVPPLVKKEPERAPQLSLFDLMGAERTEDQPIPISTGDIILPPPSDIEEDSIDEDPDIDGMLEDDEEPDPPRMTEEEELDVFGMIDLLNNEEASS